MWYKHFNKESWKIRIWRGANMKFKANELGMTNKFFNNYFKLTLLKIFRTDGALRGFVFLTLPIMIGFKSLYDRQYEEANRLAAEKEERETIISDRKRMEKFYKSRFGVATNPAQSLEIFIDFLSNGTAIAELSELNIVKDGITINEDFRDGLDTWIGEEDEKLVEYARYYKSDH